MQACPEILPRVYIMLKHSKSRRQALAVERPVVLHCRNATLRKEGEGSMTHAAKTQLRSTHPSNNTGTSSV